MVLVERTGWPTGLGFVVLETTGGCAGNMGASFCAGVGLVVVVVVVVVGFVVVCWACARLATSMALPIMAVLNKMFIKTPLAIRLHQLSRYCHNIADAGSEQENNNPERRKFVPISIWL